MNEKKWKVETVVIVALDMAVMIDAHQQSIIKEEERKFGSHD